MLASALIAPAPALALAAGAKAQPVASDYSTTTYRTVSLDGLKIFYREAGPKDAPTILLLHGYPSSSRMFATLSAARRPLPLLRDGLPRLRPERRAVGVRLRLYVRPSRERDRRVHAGPRAPRLRPRAAGLRRPDRDAPRGRPSGTRAGERRPERRGARGGLGPAWDVRKAFWKDRGAYEDKVIPGFVSLEGCKARHLGSSPHPERYDPETWQGEAAHLAAPGQRQIQSDLFFDYRTNVAAYPSWQAWLRARRPPLLILWGRYDPSFALAGAEAYRRDVPDAEVHILNAGHFALDEKVDEAAALIRAFLAKRGI